MGYKAISYAKPMTISFYWNMFKDWLKELRA